MKRSGILVIGVVLLASAVGARAEQTARWKMVCDHDAPTAASRCFLSFFAEDKASGNGLGIAVQRVDGSHEIQVTSKGGACICRIGHFPWCPFARGAGQSALGAASKNAPQATQALPHSPVKTKPSRAQVCIQPPIPSMSALGQKRTSSALAIYVRYWG